MHRRQRHSSHPARRASKSGSRRALPISGRASERGWRSRMRMGASCTSPPGRRRASIRQRSSTQTWALMRSSRAGRSIRLLRRRRRSRCGSIRRDRAGQRGMRSLMRPWTPKGSSPIRKRRSCSWAGSGSSTVPPSPPRRTRDPPCCVRSPSSIWIPPSGLLRCRPRRSRRWDSRRGACRSRRSSRARDGGQTRATWTGRQSTSHHKRSSCTTR